MRRTQQRLLEEVARVHLIVEIRDARLPLGSANPELGRFAGKPRLVLFNKASLADPAANRAWTDHFTAQGIEAIFTDTERPGDALRVQERALALTEAMRAGYARRGIRPPDARVIVLGIPNVGKSTLINRLLRRKRVATGPEPGVTRTSSWVPLRGKMMLLDTPGVLLPRIATDEDALRLGWIGALPHHLLGTERLAYALLARLLPASGAGFAARYGGAESDWLEPESALRQIAHRRQFLAPGGAPDLIRAAEEFLRDFREGQFGRHTLESPPATPAAK
jgi:ribosome biogenesis GTPase A